ncbi:MAG: metalloregulator ArsR/SmtB family transcription factor [Thermoflexales bacterium]
MITSPTLASRPPQATAAFADAPVQNALLSLSLLTSPPAPDAGEPDPWVARAAAQISDAQRLNNRIAFERFGAALLAVKDAPDMPAWLDALQLTHLALLRERSREIPPNLDADVARASAPLAEDAAALRAFLLAHVGDLWNSLLAGEWARVSPPLRGPLIAALTREHAGLRGTAVQIARAVLRRDLPDWALAALGDARSVIFVLSPHAPLEIARLGEPGTVHIFARFEPAMLRRAPVRRAEVLGPLSALADDTRLRLLEALVMRGEARGQDLIAGLGVSQPNVSRHLKQLVGAGLVEERRAGDANKLYRLDYVGLRTALYRLHALLEPANARASLDEATRAAAMAAHPPEARAFLDEAGRVTHFSTKLAEQKRVLDYLIGKIAPGREYTEREITALIAGWIRPNQGRFGIDAVTLRRALIEENALRRTSNGSKYWRENTPH